MNIVCIDDEYLILQRTAAILRRFPQVDSAEGFLDIAEALEYLKCHSVDAVFLDINMPEMNGLEVARLIRAQYNHIAIVFLTGYNQYTLDAFQMHVTGYLLKPVEEEQLLNEIQHIEQFRSDTNICML